jgi:hypothetical protein
MVMEKLGTLENPSFMSYANLAFVQLSGYDWVLVPHTSRRAQTIDDCLD